MGEENKSQEFRLKNIEEIKNYFIKEVEQNELCKKHKKVCKILNYTEHFLILASAITRCVSISVFADLVSISIGLKSSAIGLNSFAIAAAMNKLFLSV